VLFFIPRDSYWQLIKLRVTSSATSPVYSLFSAHSLFQDIYLAGRLGTFLIYMQEIRGRPGGNMKVRDEWFKGGGAFMTHSYCTEFAAAGQDAFSLVPFARNLPEERRLKAVNLQILAYPVPMSIIQIADPAAVKVCLL
jgi:hypothetical protein